MQVDDKRNIKQEKPTAGQKVRVSIIYSHNGRTLADSAKAYLARRQAAMQDRPGK